jgi:hypothetical protein
MAKKRIAAFEVVVKKWKNTKAAAKAAQIIDKIEHPKK